MILFFPISSLWTCMPRQRGSWKRGLPRGRTQRWYSGKSLSPTRLPTTSPTRSQGNTRRRSTFDFFSYAWSMGGRRRKTPKDFPSQQRPQPRSRPPRPRLLWCRCLPWSCPPSRNSLHTQPSLSSGDMGRTHNRCFSSLFRSLGPPPLYCQVEDQHQTS